MARTSDIPLHKDVHQVVPLAPTVALEETNSTNALTSAQTVVTLNSATTFIRMFADGATVLIKFDGTASTSNFDHIVPDGQMVDLHVPTGFLNDGITYISAIVLSGSSSNFIVIEY